VEDEVLVATVAHWRFNRVPELEPLMEPAELGVVGSGASDDVVSVFVVASAISVGASAGSSVGGAGVKPL
jgi:hypothetical protein